MYDADQDEGSALELLQNLGIGNSRLSIHVGEKMKEWNAIGEYIAQKLTTDSYLHIFILLIYAKVNPISFS